MSTFEIALAAAAAAPFVWAQPAVEADAQTFETTLQYTVKVNLEQGDKAAGFDRVTYDWGQTPALGTGASLQGASLQGAAVVGGRAPVDADAFLGRFDPIGAARWAPTARFGPFEVAAASRKTDSSRGDADRSGWRGGVRFVSRPKSADVLDRLGVDDSGAAAGSWYLFAGADEQALQWRSGEGAGLKGMALQDQIIVGDAQAGVGWRVGRADVAVGLIHREVKYNDAKAEEQFGGFTVVMRH